MLTILLFLANSKPLVRRALKGLVLSFWATNALASPQTDFLKWKTFYEQPEQEACFEELQNFILNYPDWPSQKTLQKKAEKALKGDTLKGDKGADKLIKWFAKHPPLTAEGAFYYAQALIQKGQLQQAKPIVKKAWQEQSFDSEFIKQFKKTFISLLSREDDLKRIDSLFMREDRQGALDMLALVSMQEKAQIHCRLTLLDFKAPASSKEGKESLVNQPEKWVYDQIKSHRRLKNYPQALSLLAQCWKAEQQHPEAWWIERNLLARHLIENKAYKAAFQLIEGHHLKSGENHIYAEWLMGWLRLKFLNQPQEAYQQFKKLYPLVKSPQSQARLAFWAAEAARALKNLQTSQEWYLKAAQHKGTYHGQLALSQLKITHKKTLPLFSFLKTNPAPVDLVKKFEARPFVKVLRTLPTQDKNKYLFFFLFKLADLIAGEGEQLLLINLAREIGGNHAAVETTRYFNRRHHILIEIGYPLLASSHQTQLVEKVARQRPLFHSLVHAIIRQESCFNPKAESSAGASGMMQLMRATAAETTQHLKNYGLKIQPQESLFQPEKNIALGSVHLDQLIKQFDGNLVLVSAAYNAGAGNVRKWLKLFGDPRFCQQGGRPLTWIDWIELIPYKETRNYVQRVMENLMVYQHRLSLARPLKIYDLEAVLKTPITPSLF